MSAEILSRLRRHPRYDALLFALLQFLRDDEERVLRADDLVRQLAHILGSNTALAASLDDIIEALIGDDARGLAWRRFVRMDANIERAQRLCKARGTLLVIEQRVFDALKNQEAPPRDGIYLVPLPEYDAIQQQLRDEQAGEGGS